jgi:pullulanase
MTDLDPARSLAVFVDRSTIALPSRLAERVSVVALIASPTAGGVTGAHTTLPLAARPAGLTRTQAVHFPHLRTYRAFTVPEADLACLLRGQLLVTGWDADGRLAVVTGVQLPGVLDDLYAEAADAELGLIVDDDRLTLAVWAPTARTVALELFGTPADPPDVLPMDRDDLTGVWTVTGDRSWLGRYYRYRVEVWHPAAQRIVTTSVTDPYSHALAVDSTHSLLVDLGDPELAPPGWDTLAKPPAVAPARMQIAEVSVRDFSIFDESVPDGERGTYLAFTRSGSTGMGHLRSLAEAGLTHVHLLPAFDFASAPDRRADQTAPVGDLAALPRDSPLQQRAVMAVAGTDGYNWGYDPLHYTVPDGSLATEPAGPARILEFRAMVTALAGAGLRVIMDVVYNHTAAAGLGRFSVLDRIVPGYYHRLLADGRAADSTCCPNTAPEHRMMGRLVVDSVVTWAREYKVDGFRFDLMGHHPRANILEVRVALDHLGDAGRDIYLYGEGWNFGEVADDARFPQATQANMAGTGIGTFNDRFRDAIRGGAPFDADPTVPGFASGLGVATPPKLQERIKVGLAGELASCGGYAAAPGEVVNYADAHDNEILYDALAFKLPRPLPAIDRARMQVLALALVVLSQGVGFLVLGTERLRSKSLDRNSYDSGDWFNAIRWDAAQGNGFGIGLPPAPENADRWPFARPLLADPALVPPPEVVDLCAERYRELLRIRRSSPVFGLPTAEEVRRRVSFPAEAPGVLVMSLDGAGLDPRWRRVVVLFNGTDAAVTQTVPGLAGVPLRLHPSLVTSADPLLRTATADRGRFTVPARSVAVFVA